MNSTSRFHQGTQCILLANVTWRAMSSNHLQDYVCDVSMDIGRQFYPLPSVAIPDIPIGRLTIPNYIFNNERKAIAEYEKDKAKYAGKKEGNISEPQQTPVTLRKVRSEGILEPSPAAVILPPPGNMKSAIANALNSFEEFEAKPSVFDLLELHTIDDKAALEQVLSSNSSSTASSSYIPLAQSVSQQPDFAQTSTFAKDWKPDMIAENIQKERNIENGTKLNGGGVIDGSLQLLTAKGYPEVYVRQCAKILPKHLQPQIECYVRSVEALSKLGADSDCALDSLLRLNFKDEQRVASFVEAVMQLCALGFGVNAVMDALCVNGARRDAALERLLQN